MNHVFVLFLVFLPALSLAEVAKPRSAFFRGGYAMPLANVKLPDSVPVLKGKLTLYADYNKSRGGRVPVYLVNRTSQRVELPSQDGDIYLKLERLRDDGHWERVQAHQYSWCGNSYLPVIIDPGFHVCISGYMPTKGMPAKVRFRTYSTLPFVSNVGTGFFLEEDRQAAGQDRMALNELPQSIRRYIDFDRKVSRQGKKVTDTEFLVALRLVSAYQESSYARTKAEAYLQIQKDQGRDARNTILAIEGVLAKKWPLEKDFESTIEIALREIPNHPAIAWSVIHEIIAAQADINTELTSRIETEFKKALLRDNSQELGKAAQLIGVSQFEGEYFDEDFLLKWVASPHDVLVRECANALSRRRKYDALAQIGSKLRPNQKLIILRALASKGSRGVANRFYRNPGTMIERNFWKQCAKEQPIKTVAALYYYGINGSYNSFDLSIHKPLRQFLIRETKSPSKNIDAWEISRVAIFVGNWNREEDTSLFKTLLEHPAYQRGMKGTKVPLEIRRYRVREEARRILLNRGEFVSKDIILHEERPIDQKR